MAAVGSQAASVSPDAETTPIGENRLVFVPDALLSVLLPNPARDHDLLACQIAKNSRFRLPIWGVRSDMGKSNRNSRPQQ
jgi:hypothetical protein